MWKVVALFEEGEDTVVIEKIFNSYWDMCNYVTTCESQGAVGGIVSRYNSSANKWFYYMDVQ